MSDEQAMAVEQEATALGWKPLDQFRGDPEKWVPAETFVERGHQVMPILKKNNEKLLADLSSTASELASLKTTVAQQAQAMKDLVTFQAAEVQRQVKAKLAGLKAEKLAAVSAGDHALAANIEEQIDEVREEAAAAPPPSAPAPPPPAARPSPESWAVAFAEENSDWFGPKADKRKTALFLGIADELKETTGLIGRALLDKAKEEMLSTLAPQGRPASKVDSGGGGGSGSSRAPGGDGKSFASLPPEAKDACREQERKFVGAGKPFKTQADWQKHYATVYFEG